MSYKNSGVDVSAADTWVEGIQSRLGAQELVSGVGDYAAVYKMNTEDWLATSCDGIGSKILWALDGLGTAKDLAQDLIAMNVNDVLCTGAAPKLFLDYLACSGKEALIDGGFLKQFIHGLIDVCKEHGQILAGGETAQMPDLYKGDHFDAAGFSIGFMKSSEYIHPTKLRDGAELWAWTSHGPHSNGFTWLRKLFDTESDAELIKTHFMAPTRIYVKDFAKLRSDLKSQLLSAYHITGSGLLNLVRSQNKHGFELSAWPTQHPAWLQAVKERSKASDQELFTTFNCGIGFIIAVAKDTDPTLLVNNGLIRIGSVTTKPGVSLPAYNLRLS